MKKIFLIMAIAIAASLQVSAQKNNNQQMTAQQRTEQRIKLLDEKLILTEEQKTKLRELYSDFNKQKYPRENRPLINKWWSRRLLKRRTENVRSPKNEN